MKIFKVLSIALAIFYSTMSFSQEINWRSLNENSKHLVSANFGADYSSYYGVSYGYYLKNKLIPVVIGSEFNMPFGKHVLDDWKWKTSIQTELLHSRNLSWSLKTGFVMRHFESEIATLYNLGTDVTTMFGYSKSNWGVCAVVNYDRAMSTRIKNDLLKEFYPEIRDGWYGTSGGNFKFGIRANRSFKTWNAYLNLGKAFGQDFKDNPTLPFYLEMSIQKQF